MVVHFHDLYLIYQASQITESSLFIAKFFYNQSNNYYNQRRIFSSYI